MCFCLLFVLKLVVGHNQHKDSCDRNSSVIFFLYFINSQKDDNVFSLL